MNLKLSNILASKEILKKINIANFSSKTAYKIQRNIKLINPELENISTIMTDLAKKYGEIVNNIDYQIKKENMDSYMLELNDLLSQEIDLDIMQISLDEFDYNLTPSEMSCIEWMFKE